jgi:hypothetical protein
MYLDNWEVYLIHDTLGEKMASPKNSDFLFIYEEKETKYNIRLILDTTLVFTGDDYAYIMEAISLNDCPDITVDIKYRGQPFWSGYINTRKANFDLDSCRIEVKPIAQDLQDCLDNILEEEVNILYQNINRQTVYLGYPNADLNIQTCILGQFDNVEIVDNILYQGGDPVYQIGDAPDFTTCGLGAENGWSLYQEKIELISVNPDGTFTVRVENKYVREEIVLDCVGGVPPDAPDDFVLVTNNCGVDGTATYGRPPVVYEYQRTGYLITSLEVDPLTWSSLDEGSSRIIDYRVSGYTSVGNITSYGRGLKLNDVIEKLTEDCALTVVSNFLGINADSTQPANDVYTRAVNEAQNLIIWQKSDIKRPTASAGATNGNTTLQEVLNMLNMFNVTYRIDGSNLRIEHISYFEALESDGDDLTALYPSRVSFRNKYTYNDVDLVRQEKFSWMDVPQDIDFVGQNIVYPNQCAEGTKEYEFGRVTTAITEIEANPDNFTDDGFVIASCFQVGSDYGINYGLGEITGDNKANAPLSFANLHANYWTYYRPFSEGRLNGSLITMDSVIPNKRQTGITYPMLPDTFLAKNWATKIKSELGYGRAEKITYSASSCIATLELLIE